MRPVASISRSAAPPTWPTATIQPSRTATSPTRDGPPEPSTIVPFRMTRSNIINPLWLLPARPQQIAGDDPLMDFGGAVINPHGADFLLHQRQRQLLGHAHGAEGLHHVVDHFEGHVRRIVLDHRD